MRGWLVPHFRMPITRQLLIAGLGATALLTPVAARAQQDGLVAHPNNYRVQFENAWVRIVHVHIPGNADLAYHTHPPGVMLHVYLNDANPIVFEHDGSPNTVTRPYVYARSYRVGRARPESHATINRFPGASDYQRIELKTQGDVGFGQRIAAPPLENATRAVTEVSNVMYRSIRLTIAARDSILVAPDSGHPALIVALTEGIRAEAAAALKLGQERFIEAGKREWLRNPGDAPVQALRVDFLTAPAAPPSTSPSPFRER
jgi:hypothetical protein